MVGWVGLEPTTNALKGRCSTIELPTRLLKAVEWLFYARKPGMARKRIEKRTATAGVA